MGQCLFGGLLLLHLEGSRPPLAPSARLQPHSVLLPSDPAGAHHHVPARHRSQGHRAAGGRPPGAACTQGREAGRGGWGRLNLLGPQGVTWENVTWSSMSLNGHNQRFLT